MIPDEPTKSNAPVTIYHLTESEIHMVGKSVCVMWNTRTIREEESDFQTGGKIIREQRVRSGKPFINFVWLRQDSTTGEWYRDEDSPASGGLSLHDATNLRDELTLAIQYLSSLEAAQ